MLNINCITKVRVCYGLVEHRRVVAILALQWKQNFCRILGVREHRIQKLLMRLARQQIKLRLLVHGAFADALHASETTDRVVSYHLQRSSERGVGNLFRKTT